MMRGLRKPCIICCKLSDSKRDHQRGDDSAGGEEEALKRCFRLLGRYLDNDDETADGERDREFRWRPFEYLINAGLSSCEDCSKVGESFCQLYDQLKSIELLVNWKVRELKDRMSNAEKLPARIKAFRECAKRLTIGGDVDTEEALNSVFSLKTDLVKKCSRKLRRALPRLRLKRCLMPTPIIPKPEIKSDLTALEPLQMEFLEEPSSPTPAYLEDDDAMQDFEISNDGDSDMDSIHFRTVPSKMRDPLGLDDEADEEDPDPANLKNDMDDDDADLNNAFLIVAVPQSQEDSEKPKSVFISEIRQHKCLLCFKKFKDFSNFEEHYQRLHLIRYKCRLCQNDKKEFILRSAFNHHYRTAHLNREGSSKANRKKPFKTTSSSSSSSLKKATLEASSSSSGVPLSSRKLSCNLCGKPFGHRSNLYAHRKNCVLRRRGKKDPSQIKSVVAIAPLSSRDPLSGKFSCDLCGKLFGHRPNLYTHRKGCALKKNKKEGPFKIKMKSSRKPGLSATPNKVSCNLCGRMFGHRLTMYNHRKKCEGAGVDPLPLSQDDLQFLCVICGKDFSENGILTEHQRKSHFPSNDLNVEELDEDSLPVLELEDDNGKNEGLLTTATSTSGSEPTLNSSKKKKIRVPSKICRAQTRTPSSKHICTVCQKEFPNSFHLLLHQRSFHFPSSNCNVEELLHEDPDSPDQFELQTEAGEGGDTDQYTFNPETNKYKCGHCGKHFRHLENFRIHYEKYSKIRFRCRLCDKVFVERCHYNHHHKVAHLGVSTSSSSIPQTGNHRPLDGLDCDICGKTFRFAAKLKEHCKEVHDKVKDNLCNLCGKAFSRARTLRTHMKTVHSELRKQESQMEASSSSKRSQEDAPLEPPMDEETDPVEVDAVGPQQSNPDGKVAPLEALGTEEETDLSYVIIRTPESEDAPEKPQSIFNPLTGKHKCQECDKKFKTPEIFQDHYQRCHHLKVKVRYKCNLCEKELKSLQSIKLHHQSVHKKVRYPCPKCGKVFTLPTSLRTHQLMTDCWKGVLTKARAAEEGSFKCHICGREYIRANHLNNHLKIVHHQGGEVEREHLCSECGKGFLEFQHLHNHLKTAHSEMREQVCHLCGMGFKMKCNLANHLRRRHGLEKNS